jgi:hypothetical protein
MTDSTTRQQTLLDQYWDADETNRQYIPDELDTSLPETIDHFHAADDAPAPDREFIGRLWAELSGDTPAASTTAPGWTDDPNDEPGERQFIPQRKGNQMQAKQQSNWRRRGRQISELVAGILVLALVTGGLILAYENLIGTGDDESAGPASEDDIDLVPSISGVQETELGTQFISAGIAQIDDQDYLITVGSPEVDPVSENVELRLQHGGTDDQADVISTLQAPVPWDQGLLHLGAGPITSQGGILYIPLAEDGQPGLWVVDATDPEDPVELEFIETEDFAASLAVSDEFLVTTGYFGGEVAVYDITEPDSPELQGSLEISAPTRPRMTIDESTLFVVRGRALEIIDLSSPGEPAVVGSLENPDWEGLEETVNEVTEITPVSPEGIIEQVLAPGVYSDIVAVNDYVFLSAGKQGVIIIDVSDPSEPEEVQQLGRDDHTFRLEESEGFLYVLGADAVEEDDSNARLVLSLDVLDISDPENPTLVDREEDIAADFETAGFALMMQHFAHDGDSLFVYGNFTLAYLAQIDWLEPANEGAEEAPTPEPESTDIADEEPTPESDEPSSEVPGQDPREVVSDLLNAAFGKEWETVRDLSVDPVSALSDEALNHTVGELRGPVGSDRIGPEYWDIETYRDWTALRHVDEPTYSVLLTAHEDEWWYYPSPYWLTMGQSVDAITEAGGEPEDVSQLLKTPAYDEHRLEGDLDEPQLDEHFQIRIDTVLPDEDSVVVDFMITILNADQAAFELDDVHWSVDGENVTGALIWTRSRLQGDETRVVMPAHEDGRANHRFAFEITGLPEDIESLGLEIDNVQISGIDLDSRDGGSDEVNLSAYYEFPLEPIPNLESLDAGGNRDAETSSSVAPAIDSEDLTVYFPRQADRDIEQDSVGTRGTLALDGNGCLRMDDSVIIWPHSGYDVEMVNGEVAIVDEQTRDVVASVGDEVTTGPFHREVTPDYLNAPLPEACAGDGGYFISGPGIGAQ